MRANTSTEALGFRLEFKATAELGNKPLQESHHPSRRSKPGTLSTTLHVDDRYVVKLQRKLEAGVDPEIEIGSFLTGVAGFANTPALLGTVKLVHDGHRTAVASVHEFVQNQGDAWAVTSAYLDRFIDEQRLIAGDGRDARKRRAGLLSALHGCRPAAGSRKCRPRWRAATTSRISGPSRQRPRASARLVEEAIRPHGPALRDSCPRRATACRMRDRALADRLLAAKPQLRGRFEELSTDCRPTGSTSAITATSIWGRCSSSRTTSSSSTSRASRIARLPIAAARRRPRAMSPAYLRSIDFSVAVALERALKVSTDDQGKLAAALEHWRDQSIATFMTAYHEALTETRLWPEAAQACECMLRFFQLERAALRDRLRAQ